MKTKIILITLVLVSALFAACGQQTPTKTSQQTTASQVSQPMLTQSQARVPAHYQNASSIGTLLPTLPPERFIGPTQQAYRVAQEIPETLAQLPCYCHCDMSMGHKSLHSCYEDMHASQCAVCVSEALMAYDLQKSGMTPAQIRDRIITIYSRQ
jgi:ABC-type transport system substrate-binding protein